MVEMGLVFKWETLMSSTGENSILSYKYFFFKMRKGDINIHFHLYI